jgi:hypothetical protein
VLGCGGPVAGPFFLRICSSTIVCPRNWWPRTAGCPHPYTLFPLLDIFEWRKFDIREALADTFHTRQQAFNTFQKGLFFSKILNGKNTLSDTTSEKHEGEG